MLSNLDFEQNVIQTTRKGQNNHVLSNITLISACTDVIL